MAKTKISEFSSTPANNTDIDSINIAEGCAPSGINDAIRELMAQLKDFQTGAQGDSFNGPIGTSTAAAGAFTTLSATGAITSTLATGTAPLVIASTTKVANLNVDLLDGADWASPAALGSTTPAAVSATTLSASSTVTLSGGTANGVAYLNGSKVVTSGSALTYNGTGLGIGVASASNPLHIDFDGTAARIVRGSAIGFLYNTGTTSTDDFRIQSNAGGVETYAVTYAKWTLAASEQMRLTSTGLGIGTSSPTQKLTVNSSYGANSSFPATSGTTQNGLLRLTPNSNTYGETLDFGMNVGPTYGWIQSTNATNLGTNYSLALNPNGGNVGIGTSSPLAKLDSRGTAIITSNANGDNVLAFGNTSTFGGALSGAPGGSYGNSFIVGESSTGSGAPGFLKFYTTAGGAVSERFRISSDGTLLVRGGSLPTLNQYDAPVIFRVSGGGLGLAGAYETGSSPIVFYTAGTERARINEGGNLGIGTTSISSKLYVAGGTNNELLRVGNTNAIGSQYISIWANGSEAVYNSVNTQNAVYGSHIWQSTNNGGTVERARIDSSGNLLVGTTSAAGKLTVRASGTENVGNQIANFVSDTSGDGVFFFLSNGTAHGNASLPTIAVNKNTATGRSINAEGTINASGADYAEYMTKAGNFTIAKGDVVGIDAQGKLTNVFANAVSFVVKSTDPSYVGGDTWGSEEVLGKRPKPDATQEEIDNFNVALEAVRALVDRIAFAGQVPVNVLGATAGQYIIPVNDNGAIKGQAVSNPTFEQYQASVGKVIAIESDGRARIIVKVA